MIKNWNSYNDNNNKDILEYDKILINEIKNMNVNIILENQIEKEKINITNINLEIPNSMNTPYIKKSLNNFVIIIEYILNNLNNIDDDIKYLNYIKDIFDILNDIFKYNNNNNNILNNNNITRSSYNFCNKFPICFDYYNNLIKTKYKSKCINDHITLNKIYKDYVSVYNYIINTKQRDIDNIRKSLNTILFVLKENIKIINNIIDIIKNKKIELQDKVTLYNFLLKN